MILTVVVVMTTIHAQDFPDVAGDRVRGRKTIPLVYDETWTRAALAVFVIFWSIVSLSFWHVQSRIAWLSTTGVGGLLAFKTTLRREKSSDELVWRLWCSWVVSYTFCLFSALVAE
ncbi:hypothetical protein GGR54DRAFT_601611 [Hypoxylon sp. NC1633]|nr:hypothetical protein GGR54DRAFT_601611 [Hypoxylon sp. NC1633]